MRDRWMKCTDAFAFLVHLSKFVLYNWMERMWWSLKQSTASKQDRMRLSRDWKSWRMLPVRFARWYKSWVEIMWLGRSRKGLRSLTRSVYLWIWNPTLGKAFGKVMSCQLFTIYLCLCFQECSHLLNAHHWSILNNIWIFFRSNFCWIYPPWLASIKWLTTISESHKRIPAAHASKFHQTKNNEHLIWYEHVLTMNPKFNLSRG